MSLNDTITACATPIGYSGIAVIRLSGAQALAIAKKVFRPQSGMVDFKPNCVYFGDFFDSEKNCVVDKILLTTFFAPHSYTGEDVVEFSCHGNPLIVERIITALLNQGARLAQKGEFTKRALLNGKIDLIQAEAVLDTVYASCEQARRVALAQYEGKLSDWVYSLRAKIVDLLLLIEASLDFPEEEETEIEELKIHQTLQALIDDLDWILKGAQTGVKIKEGYRVLIMGRTNVGKSTLFNRLVGFERAIVHSEPGTTRDYIEEDIELAGLFIRLFDTAGVFSGAKGVDQKAVEKTQGLLNQADLILLMFDGSEPVNEEDIELYDLTKEHRKLQILNKIDLNFRIGQDGLLSDSIKISAKTGENIGLLIDGIKQALLPKNVEDQLLVTRTRHIEILKSVRGFLKNALNGQTLETVAFELHTALNRLGELTGQVMRKEILDRIFEEFCIGK